MPASRRSNLATRSVLWKLDGLGRNLRHLVNTVEDRRIRGGCGRLLNFVGPFQRNQACPKRIAPTRGPGRSWTIPVAACVGRYARRLGRATARESMRVRV